MQNRRAMAIGKRMLYRSFPFGIVVLLQIGFAQQAPDPSYLIPNYWQLLNLNPAMRVAQSTGDVLIIYSVVYQKVQSSDGSICIAL